MNRISTIGRNRTSLTVILSLGFIYILLVVLTLHFSNVIMKNVSLKGSFITVITISLIIVVPFALLVILVVNVVAVLRERRANRPGNRLRVRLILYFVLISFLSAIPQALLSVNFTGTMLESWYDSRIGTALNGGLDIALEFYRDKLKRLEDFSETELQQYLRSPGTDPGERVWKLIGRRFPEIASYQVCDADGRERFFAGDGFGRASAAELKGVRDSFLPKLTVPGESIVRYAKTSAGSPVLTTVVSIRIPSEFDRKAEALTQSIETFSQTEKYRNVFLYAIIGFYLLFSLPMMLFALLIAFMLSESFVQPIINLEEATRRVSGGDFSFRILTRSKDELSTLSTSFNLMVAELETSRLAILQNEKITVWQDIARRLAHEIRNPLTPIKLNAERILRKLELAPHDLPAILEPAMQSIIREVDGLNALLSEFRDFAKLPGPQFEWCNLKNLVHETVQAYETSFPEVSFAYERVDESINLTADRGHLKQAFSNLFRNAIDAMNGAGSVRISADLVKKANSLYCRIQVQDNGCGIPEDIRSRVFAPYFTTKSFGTGLGLSIVEHIIIDHHGQIWFETEKGVGTTFLIDLPVEQQKVTEEP